MGVFGHADCARKNLRIPSVATTRVWFAMLERRGVAA
jgi:hypothetical protein